LTVLTAACGALMFLNGIVLLSNGSKPLVVGVLFIVIGAALLGGSARHLMRRGGP
jgi:hypothetical protein